MDCLDSLGNSQSVGESRIEQRIKLLLEPYICRQSEKQCLQLGIIFLCNHKVVINSLSSGQWIVLRSTCSGLCFVLQVMWCSSAQVGLGFKVDFLLGCEILINNSEYRFTYFWTKPLKSKGSFINFLCVLSFLRYLEISQ